MSKSDQFLPRFGKGHMGDELGYNLDLIVSWLESMVYQEAENRENREGKSIKGLREKRYTMAESALELLQRVQEMTEEED